VWWTHQVRKSALATIAGVLTRDDVVSWAARAYGPRRAPARVTEHPAAFRVDTSDEGTGRSVVVRKQSGGYWYVGDDPVSQCVYTADNDRDLRRALKTVGLDPARPAGSVAPAGDVPRERVVDWLAAHRSWRRVEERVTDLGWAYLVNTQPDDCLAGKAGLSRDAGPLLVVKSTGAVWELPWSPKLVPAIGAPDEPTFHARVAAAGFPLPGPADWVTSA
jgi:hypothetical protein